MISVFDDNGVILCGGTIMRVQGEEFGTEAACGEPVLTMSSAETRLPTLTTCGLSIRKSRIQLQVGVGTPRSVSSPISLPGRMVLKATRL